MSKYLESCKTEFWREVFEKELEYILRELKGYKNVLSVGCGPAIIERGLQENGFNVTGLDVSKEALEGAPDSIRAVIGSAENMDFEDASFDAAIYVASLQFIDNYEEAIQETARVLKPKGRLLVMLLNPKSDFFEERWRRTDSYVRKIKHKENLDIEKIKEAILKYFDSIKTEYYLGIKSEKIFETKDPNLTALYVIQGRKK